MDDLHQEHEEIDALTDPVNQAEGSKEARNKRLVLSSLGALTVTVAATIAVVFGASASNSELIANRSRQLMATYAGRLTLAQDAYSASYRQWWDGRTRYYWQEQFLNALSGGTRDSALEAQVAAMAQQALAAKTRLIKPPTPPSTPAYEGPGNPGACTGSLDSTCTSQLSTSYGNEATQWLKKERYYLAIVSMFAVSLFLFALTRSVDRPAMQVMFLLVAGSIGLIALIWMVTEATLAPVQPPSSQGASDLAEGNFILGQPSNSVRGTLTTTSLTSAIDDLKRATVESPDLPLAWDDLGYAISYNAKGRLLRGNCAGSIRYFQKAVALSDAALSSSYENDLANEEFKCNQLKQSVRDLRASIAQNPLNSFALGSLAEESLIAGGTQWFKDLFHATEVAAFDLKHPNHAAVHGPVWRDPWFASLRSDETAMKQIGVPQARLNEFFGDVVGDQGELNERDIVGRYDHDDVHNASFTTMSEHYGSPIVADTAGDVLFPGSAYLDIAYSNLRKGQIVTVSWYELCSDPFAECNYRVLGIPTTALTVGADSGPGVSGSPHAGSGVLELGPFFPQSARYEIDVTLNDQEMGFGHANVPVTFTKSQGSD